MNYEKYNGFVIESIEVDDETANGEKFTTSHIVIRRLGHQKYLDEVSTVEDGRAWIDENGGAA